MSNRFKFDGKKYIMSDYSYISLGMTPLTYIFTLYHQDPISSIKLKKFISKNKEQLNKQDKKGDSALIYVCNNSNRKNLVDLVKVFLECEADVNIKGNAGHNALSVLCARVEPRSKLEDVIITAKLLIDAKIETHITHNDLNILELCCVHYNHNNNMKVYEELIKLVIDDNMKGKFTYTEEEILNCLKYDVCKELFLSYLEKLFYRKIGYDKERYFEYFSLCN